MSKGRFRLGALLLVVVLTVSLLPTALTAADSQGVKGGPFVPGEALTGGGFQVVATAGTVELLADPATGNVQLKDTATGQSVRAFPEFTEEQHERGGYHYFNMNSALLVEYINDRLVVQNPVNSMLASVRKDGLTTFRIPDGVRFDYRFPDIGLTIPVACVLKDGALEVSVIVEEIKEEGTYQLLECAVMPYLGSAAPEDTGWLLTPDGSGALVEFSADSENPMEVQYKKPVYGRDPMSTLLSQNSNEEDVLLPVFAIRKNDSTVLGTITEGAAVSALQIYPKGAEGQYSTIHPVMTYRSTHVRTLFDTSWEKKKSTIVAANPTDLPAYTVRYSLLGNADYSAVASAVADWLQEQGATRRTGVGAPATVQLLGAVKKPQSVLGVPTNVVTAFTDYTQATALVEQLQKAGVGVMDLVYYGQFDGGLYDAMPTKAKLEGKLGSQEELSALQALIEKAGGRFFPAADLASIYTSGNGIAYEGDACRDVAGGRKEIAPFSAVTFNPDTNASKYTILAPDKLGEVYSRFVSRLTEQNLTAFADCGTDRLSSDNRLSVSADSRDRQEALALWDRALQESTGDLTAYMVSKAAGWTLPYATHVNAAPTASSREDVFTREIPFYSLVASRFAKLSADAVNFTENRETYLLRCIEYGMTPAVFLCGEDPADLWDTGANWLYAADTADLTGWLGETCTAHSEVLRLVASSALEEHTRLQTGVYRCRYEGGKTVYINYTAAEVTVEGQRVAAGSYALGGAA